METAQQFDTKITSAKTILLDIEGTTTSKSFVKVGHKSHVSSKYTNPLFTFIRNRVNWMICVIVYNGLDEEWVNFGKKNCSVCFGFLNGGHMKMPHICVSANQFWIELLFAKIVGNRVISRANENIRFYLRI